MARMVQEVGVPGFVLENFLPYRLAAVTDRVSRVFAAQFNAAFDLTIAEWRVLAAVAEHETLSPTRIGEYTSMDKVKVSRAAQGLTARGLLRQSLDPRDRRGRLLRLTRKGATAHAGMVPLAARIEETVFGGLNRSEIAALSRILEKISARLETNEQTEAATDE